MGNLDPTHNKRMRLQWFQHVPFEDLANIGVWAQEKGFSVKSTRFFMDDPLPAITDFDWLVVMGGPMNIYEDEKYPWLQREKFLISEAIEQGKVVLGICLGAQLIADVLGGRVTSNQYKEIGWFPIATTENAQHSSIFHAFPKRFAALHWHGDTFDIPPGAKRIARSEACPNQAFEYDGGRVIGLQFHLESTPRSIRKLIENCGNELVEGRYIQKPEDMLALQNPFDEIYTTMNLLLDSIYKKFGS